MTLRRSASTTNIPFETAAPSGAPSTWDSTAYCGSNIARMADILFGSSVTKWTNILADREFVARYFLTQQRRGHSNRFGKIVCEHTTRFLMKRCLGSAFLRRSLPTLSDL